MNIYAKFKEIPTRHSGHIAFMSCDQQSVNIMPVATDIAGADA